MVTYYVLRAAWLKLLRPAIDYVVRTMHRIVMRDMQYRLETQVPATLASLIQTP